MENRSDEQLISDYLKGQEAALSVLFNRYLRPIYGFIYQYSANSAETEDIVQEVFIKVWRGLKRFDQKRSFKTWLYAIAKNAAIDASRRRKTLSFSSFENSEGANPIIENLADDQPLSSEILEKSELTDLILEASTQLHPTYQAVLRLRYSEELTFKEIAKHLNTPLDTVKSQCRRALLVIKKLLSANPHQKSPLSRIDNQGPKA